MSKISQLHAELTQQAAELGFESIEDAEANGYGIDYKNQKLFIPKPDPKLDEAIEEAIGEAHEAWLKERGELLERLKKKQEKLKRMLCDDTGLYALITDAINFIEKGEM